MAHFIMTPINGLARVIVDGGDDLLIAKSNQPTLQEDTALLVSQPPVPWLTAAETRTAKNVTAQIRVFAACPADVLVLLVRALTFEKPCP